MLAFEHEIGARLRQNLFFILKSTVLFGSIRLSFHCDGQWLKSALLDVL
jgi:hypothetical protein